MVLIDMKGKVTLVTGAGGGIGGGIANVFAQAGSKVYVADLKFDNAKAKADELVSKGYDALPVALDVTNKEQIYEAIDKIVADNGKIDNLITCAGIMYNVPFMNSTDEQLRRTLEINLISVNNTCQAALRHMLPRKEGKIVNIQSMNSRGGSAISSHYATSKFGVMGLTQSIALAVAKDKINVNGICPGIIMTTLGEGDNLFEMKAKASGITVEEAENQVRSMIPMGTFQSAEDIGDAALFFCSDLAANITGQSLNVCGGMRLN